MFLVHVCIFETKSQVEPIYTTIFSPMPHAYVLKSAALPMIVFKLLFMTNPKTGVRAAATIAPTAALGWTPPFRSRTEEPVAVLVIQIGKAVVF